jgi:hypothetical protein
VGGKGQDVGDHPAVREDLRRVADRVHEALAEPALADDRLHLREERRPRRAAALGLGRLSMTSTRASAVSP